MVTAIGRTPVELRGLVKKLASRAQCKYRQAHANNFEVIVDGAGPHARVLHTMGYHRIGIPLGQGHSIVKLSIPDWCNPIGIIRNESHNSRSLGGTKAWV